MAILNFWIPGYFEPGDYIYVSSRGPFLVMERIITLSKF
jgi:hypothetical protein